MPDGTYIVKDYLFNPNNTTANAPKIVTLLFEDGLVNLGNYAFAYCSTIRTNTDSRIAIDLPVTLKTIGEYAFYQCSSAQTLALSTNTEFKTISKGAFEGCLSLTYITIPTNINTIGERAFANCSTATVLTLNSGSISAVTSGVFFILDIIFIFVL